MPHIVTVTHPLRGHTTSLVLYGTQSQLNFHCGHTHSHTHTSNPHKQWHPTPAYTAPHTYTQTHTPRDTGIHKRRHHTVTGNCTRPQCHTTKTTHTPWRHESQPHTRSGHTVTTVLTPQEQGEQATYTTGTHAVSPPVTRTLHPDTLYHTWLHKNHQTDTLETGGYTCTVADTHTQPHSHKDTFRTAHPQPAPACAHRFEAPDTPRPRPGLPDPSPSASPGRVRVLAELTSSPRRQERHNVRPLWALGIVVQS